jgi:hypothetical protein
MWTVMEALMKPMIPTIHRDGTSLRELEERYWQAIEAVDTAITAVEKTAPNPVDYPVGYSNARLNHTARLNLLRGVRRELSAIVDGLPEIN